MLRRLAFRDFLLLAVSVSVIALFQWPQGQERQIISCRDPGGQVQQYSLPANDPRLVELADQIRQWKDGGFSSEIAIARWRVELADFYAQHSSHAPVPETAAVVPVAFEQLISDVPDALTPDLAAYWTQAKQGAEQDLRLAQQQMDERQQSEAPAPVELGEIVPAGLGIVPLLIAAVTGIGVASGFVLWSSLFPTIHLRESNSQAGSLLDAEKGNAASPLELEIPAEWVHVHQPLGVHARRLSYLAIVAAAMVCVVL